MNTLLEVGHSVLEIVQLQNPSKTILSGIDIGLGRGNIESRVSKQVEVKAILSGI